MERMHFFLVGAVIIVGSSVRANFPVVDPTFDGNDYAVVNQGQLKTVASYWAQELALSDVSVSSGILDRINGFTSADNNAVVNLGQLKAVVQPFYDHLNSVAPDVLPQGVAGGYPWSNPDSPPSDYAVANIGQVKYVFNFDLSAYQTGSNAANISGLATYAGSQVGSIYVIASVQQSSWNHLFSQTLSQAGAFSVTVAAGTNYWMKAFVDVDGNGIGNGTEPFVVYPLVVNAGNSSIVMALQDAVGGQWLELNYFGVLALDIDLIADADGDGISNGDEFQNGTDWCKADTDGDGLADNLETTTDPLNPDSNGNGLGDGSEKELDDSLAANPLAIGVLVNVPNRGFYHAAETNLTLNYLGRQ